MQPSLFTAVAAILTLAACSTSSRRSAPFGADEQGLVQRHPPVLVATVATVAPPTLLATPTPLPQLQPEITQMQPGATAAPSDLAEFAEPESSTQARPKSKPRWRDGDTMLQGYFGATIYDEITRSGGGSPTVEITDDDLQVPAIGGGGQLKLGGDDIHFGLEGMIGFNWRADATAFAVGGGGAVVAVDVDLFLFDLYGGPFASMFLGNSVRLYAAAGPMMQWGQYEDSLSGSGSSNGFGLGYYARTGLEFLISQGTWLGLGVRWSDSTIDLDEGADLDLAGMQFALTVSRFY